MRTGDTDGPGYTPLPGARPSSLASAPPPAPPPPPAKPLEALLIAAAMSAAGWFIGSHLLHHPRPFPFTHPAPRAGARVDAPRPNLP